MIDPRQPAGQGRPTVRLTRALTGEQGPSGSAQPLACLLLHLRSEFVNRACNRVRSNLCSALHHQAGTPQPEAGPQTSEHAGRRSSDLLWEAAARWYQRQPRGRLGVSVAWTAVPSRSRRDHLAAWLSAPRIAWIRSHPLRDWQRLADAYGAAGCDQKTLQDAIILTLILHYPNVAPYLLPRLQHTAPASPETATALNPEIHP
jgi:hypothetical protein